MANILWLMTDEQRCDSLGCYESPWAYSPNIDALASDGALFSCAVTPAPVCVPARTSMLSGKYPCQTGVWHNKVDMHRPVPNLLGRFREAGYRTASFGKQHYAGAGSAFETESGPCLSDHVGYFKYADGYDESHYDVLTYPGDIYNWIFGGRFPSSPDETAEAIVCKNAMNWLENYRANTPFFLRLSFNGPHTPVSPPKPFDGIIRRGDVTYSPDAENLPAGSAHWLSKELRKCADASVLSSDQIQRMRQYYYGEVAYLDSLFGRFLDWMKDNGFLDNTVVVYLSDHGTHLGDFGLVQKQTFFEPVVTVPFVIRCPDSQGHLRFRTPVETLSLLPTLMDLTGIDSPGDGYAPSLAESVRTGVEPDSRPVFSEFTLKSFDPHIKHAGRLVMVRMGDWKLSVCIDPEIHDVMLHDVTKDRFERTNRAEDPECRTIKNNLLGLIQNHLATESA
jgi:choline-sulfatase